MLMQEKPGNKKDKNIYIKNEREIKASYLHLFLLLLRLSFFSFLSFFSSGPASSVPAGLIEVMERGLTVLTSSLSSLQLQMTFFTRDPRIGVIFQKERMNLFCLCFVCDEFLTTSSLISLSLFFSSLALSLSPAGDLQVSISLKKVELSVGESKFFTCTAIGEPVSLDWYNPQGERMVPSPRVALHNEGVRSRLTLYNANVEDAGIYRCQATDAQGQTQEATVVLEIYQKLTFRDVPSPQEFRQGDVAEVVCDVTSSPVPVIAWYYNNMEIFEDTEKFQLLSNNNLQVQRVTKADEGVYRCEARVEARGEIDFRDIILVVNVPPVLSVPQQSFNATADYGESVTFTCRAYGSPEPDVTWHRKGVELQESEQYVMRARGTTLTIRNIKQDDGGSYTCKASNKAGEVQQEIVLKVFVQPHITKLRNVTAVEGSAAMISCKAEGEPLPDISWRRASDGYSFSDGDKSPDGRVEVRGRRGESMLTIVGVGLSDWGRFDCEALSRIGGHQKSMFLDIEYAPKFQTNHTIFFSWEGNPVNISCDVMSNPPATMLWRRDKLTIPTEGTANMRVHNAPGRSLLEVTPMSDRDFGRYNCTARNNIGMRFQEFILAQADVPSNPYSVRLSSIAQRTATVTFMKPDSHGGVPIDHYLVRYKDISSHDWRDVQSHGTHTIVLLTNLEPNTTYEVRVAAVNGKGQGEFSRTESFQTLPIREPSPPSVQGQRGVGKAYRLGLVKQDDGGMPILEYIVKYKTDKEEQWMTKLVPGLNDFVVLQPLQWNTQYEVEITARNVKGLSEPTFVKFSMPQKPDITDQCCQPPATGHGHPSPHLTQAAAAAAVLIGATLSLALHLCVC
uniref:Neural cell adhesion molecule 2 n=1 Tax=Astyanax mexicanus TaxID=7994 RepID=A0A3B1JJ38_ASTMX